MTRGEETCGGRGSEWLTPRRRGINSSLKEKKKKIWIKTDRKISQGRWTKGQQGNNQKLHESGVEVEMLETQIGAVANRRSEEKRLLFERQHRHWKFEDWCNVLFTE